MNVCAQFFDPIIIILYIILLDHNSILHQCGEPPLNVLEVSVHLASVDVTHVHKQKMMLTTAVLPTDMFISHVVCTYIYIIELKNKVEINSCNRK